MTTVHSPKPNPRTTFTAAITGSAAPASRASAGIPIRAAPATSKLRCRYRLISGAAVSSAATVPSSSTPVTSPAPALPAPAVAAYIGVTDSISSKLVIAAKEDRNSHANGPLTRRSRGGAALCSGPDCR
jgi:hypothetical protein